MKLQLCVGALLLSAAAARCPNGCSGNGECGTNSQCLCHRNFMGADCSERICYFSYAFVDTPLGDINADGIIDMKINKDEKTKNYATEAYDIMYGVARPIETTVDTDGDGFAYNEALQSGRWDEAHFYRECSNKGICNRATGQCVCFPGYEGEGCQRTSCPGAESGSPCSGHGLCLSAYVDYTAAEYNLWDRDKTMKCKCDAGYDGPDCSLRLCPKGPDPVEHADKVTTSLQKISWGAFELDTTSTRTTHSGAFNGPLYFTITVEDDFGDSWTTKSLSIDYQSVFDDVNSVLYSQPVPSADFLGGVGSDIYDFYLNTNIADDVNASVRALPNHAVADAYVWMEYRNLEDDTRTDSAGELFNSKWGVAPPTWVIGTDSPDFVASDALRYPYSTDTNANTGFQPTSGSGITKYWESSGSRFPDFTNSEFAECGQIMQLDDDTSTDMAAEGLCIFISTSNKVRDGSNYVITYSTNPVVSVTDGTTATSYAAKTMTGFSTSIVRTGTATGKALDGDLVSNVEVLSAGTKIDGSEIPVVTVEEVGHRRYWDVNIDGYPKRSYTGFNSDECSRRGLCDYESGECQCFSGYTGIACSSQNSISFS